MRRLSALVDATLRLRTMLLIYVIVPVGALVLLLAARDACRDYWTYRDLAEDGIEALARVDQVLEDRSQRAWRRNTVITYSFKSTDGQAHTVTTQIKPDAGPSVRAAQTIRIVYVPSQPSVSAASTAHAWDRFVSGGLRAGLLASCLIFVIWLMRGDYKRIGS